MAKSANAGKGAHKGTGKFKSAVSGKFVSPHYAKTHPKTTYKQGK